MNFRKRPGNETHPAALLPDGCSFAAADRALDHLHSVGSLRARAATLWGTETSGARHLNADSDRTAAHAGASRRCLAPAGPDDPPGGDLRLNRARHGAAHGARRPRRNRPPLAGGGEVRPARSGCGGGYGDIPVRHPPPPFGTRLETVIAGLFPVARGAVTCPVRIAPAHQPAVV